MCVKSVCRSPTTHTSITVGKSAPGGRWRTCNSLKPLGFSRRESLRVSEGEERGMCCCGGERMNTCSESTRRKLPALLQDASHHHRLQNKRRCPGKQPAALLQGKSNTGRWSRQPCWKREGKHAFRSAAEASHVTTANLCSASGHVSLLWSSRPISKHHLKLHLSCPPPPPTWILISDAVETQVGSSNWNRLWRGALHPPG